MPSATLPKMHCYDITKYMIWLIYSFQVLVILAAIGIIMLQKAGDGIFSSSKVFGIRGRPNTIIRITYLLGAIFFVNNLVLGIMYKKEHKNQLIKENTEKVLEKKDVKKEVELQKKTNK